jgi:hypothetical protein
MDYDRDLKEHCEWVILRGARLLLLGACMASSRQAVVAGGGSDVMAEGLGRKAAQGGF